MDWTQTLTIIVSVFGMLLVLFAYLMSRMDATNEKIESTKKELEQKMTAEIRDLKVDINQRITDFKTDVNQRLSTIEGYLVPRKVFRFEEPDSKEKAKEN